MSDLQILDHDVGVHVERKRSTRDDGRDWCTFRSFRLSFEGVVDERD